MLDEAKGKKVVVVGDAGVDIIVRFPRFLNEERTNVEYETPFLIGGGTSANTAVALARLGITPCFIGTIGDDQYGRYVVEDFKREGVNLEHLIIDPEVNTVGVFAFIDERGERYLWGWPRTKQSFRKLDLNRIDFELIKSADWVHSSGMAIVAESSARKTITEILKFAYRSGVTTSFDLNLRVNNGQLDKAYKNAVCEIMDSCNYVLGSGAEEFYYLNPQADWRESVRSLVTPNRTVIARMGSGGSMACAADEEVVAEAYQVEVVDLVGAGDIYNAGYIAAKLCGWGLKESIGLGNAVAGYSVAKESARSSPGMEELAFFLQTHQQTEKEGRSDEKGYFRL